jgi:hypothetical protein
MDKSRIYNCRKCHTCGAKLQTVLDGEEWCNACQQYRRYYSHGWSHANCDKNSDSCPANDKEKERNIKWTCKP